MKQFTLANTIMPPPFFSKTQLVILVDIVFEAGLPVTLIKMGKQEIVLEFRLKLL
jgi:hypothetical protein